MSYKYFNISERGNILFCIASNFSISETANYIGRNKFTVSGELKRNSKFIHRVKLKRVIKKGVKIADLIKNLKIRNFLNL